MKTTAIALSMGLGAVVGAVAVMMLPSSCSARKLAAKAANKVEDAAWKVSSKLTDQMDFL